MDAERFSWRVRVHAALADAHRLAIVDELALSDRTPSELAAMLDIESNLLAHHLTTLEAAGLIERIASQGDRRRRYIRLTPTSLQNVETPTTIAVRRVVFVCTENAARSQLAQAIWNQSHPVKAVSGGTAPAQRIHPGTLKAAARLGINLDGARPAPLPHLETTDLVITVCDRAHKALGTRRDVTKLHWSVPDPATNNSPRAFDTSADIIASRIGAVREHVQAA